MDTSKENLATDDMDQISTEIPELMEQTKQIPKKRKNDTTTARNQKKIYREIMNRENEAQTQNLNFIFHRLSNIDNKLTSIISAKRKFDQIDEEEFSPLKKNKKEVIDEVKNGGKKLIQIKNEVDKGWNIKGTLLNLAVGTIATFTIKFAANYIKSSIIRKTNDGDNIQFPSYTF